MARYLFSNKAKSDLFRIFSYGVEHFGEQAATNYYDTLFECFDRISANPEQFQLVNEIRVGYRRAVCGKESIYFRQFGDQVEVMRILKWQDVDRELI